MKKILSILLVACMAVSLAGCSSGSDFTVGEFCDAYNKGLDVWSGKFSVSSISMSHLGVINENGVVPLDDSAEIRIYTKNSSVSKDDSIQEIMFVYDDGNGNFSSNEKIFYTQLFSFFEAALPNATSDKIYQLVDCYTKHVDSLPDLSDGEIIDNGIGSVIVNYSGKKAQDYTGKYHGVAYYESSSAQTGFNLEINKFGSCKVSFDDDETAADPVNVEWRVNEDTIIIGSGSREIFRGKINNNSITLSDKDIVLEKE